MIDSLRFSTGALAAALARPPPGGSAGLLGGALTSTPLLAAAQDWVERAAVSPAAISIRAMPAWRSCRGQTAHTG